MRVIAGVAKGRKLVSPQGRTVRPSKDRVKEALFSSLGPRVVGARVLDLYAGTGALGIEALSRGAAQCAFVEPDPDAEQVVRANLDATGLSASANVLRMTAEEFVQDTQPDPFHLVLIDPPYEVGLPSDILAQLDRRGFLVDGARVVIEVSSRTASQKVDSYEELARKRYGDSSLIYLEYKGAD